MKVLFICPYPREIASTRQRVLQYVPYLIQKGVVCHVSSFMSSNFYKFVYRPRRVLGKIYYTFSGCARRFNDLLNLSTYDVVFVQREAFPFGTTFVEQCLAARRPVIYDFDDAIYRMNPAKPSLAPFLRRPSKVTDVISLARCIIAGNRYLAEYAAQYNKHVRIVPTCIDTDNYTPPVSQDKEGTLVIGWIGSRTTISYLLDIKDVLSDVAKKYNVVFRVVANDTINLGFRTEFKQWTLDEELEDLRDFDIGIMPLPDNEWTRAKCGYKIIQYMSVGKPVVASPVGVNREIIQDGCNGYLAEGQKHWYEKLSALIEDGSLRTEFGKRGRRTVEERYSLKVNAPKVYSIIEKSAQR